jgi:hypothetical protein
MSEFSADHLHLERIDGQKLEKPLILKIPRESLWELPLNDWLDASGAECSGPDQREHTAHSKINILRVTCKFSLGWRGYRTIKAISGEFSGEFSDGRKLEGSFVAKTRKAKERRQFGLHYAAAQFSS